MRFSKLYALFLVLIFIGILSRKNKNNLIIGFGGDIMIGRLVNEVIPQTSMSYPWGNLLPLLHATDLNMVNLETTLTTSSQRVPKVFNYKSDPAHVKVLQSGNIKVVSLANNHILDFDVQGLQETIQTLDTASILHVGAGMNRTEAQNPVIIERKNIKIGIIGYTDNEPGWEAGPEKPGINYLKVGDIEKVKKDLQSFNDDVDLIILSYHWGPNKRQRPTKEFQTFAHQLIDAGVDIIHGHSAHIFQGIEVYNDKVIMYDTGDFVDDYAVDELLRNDQSFFFIVSIDPKTKKIIMVKLTPLIISNMQVNKATEKQAHEIIQKMQQLSSELGTFVSDKGIITI